MEISPIRTEKDYNKAIRRIEELWWAKPSTRERDELEVLSILVEAYEDRHYPILPPDPIEAIKFRMDQLGLRKVDVASYFGGRNRVTEILKRKRNLNVNIMRLLHKNLMIPAESLLA